MTRAVIYARFSTELQNEKSTEDQIALCRSYANRLKIDVIATFEDRARSGASVFGRDGLMQLMDAARQRLFDVVIVEALDRLSRDMEDLAGLYKRLSFQGIEIQAVHDGTADAILIGIRGLVGQMQREDGAKKVRRGMAGVVRDGRHAGGRAYGALPLFPTRPKSAIFPPVVRLKLPKFNANRFKSRTCKRVCYNRCFWGYSASGGKDENGHQLAT
jgi:site-specific DNA recombinase